MEAKVPVQVKQYYIAVGSRDVKLVRHTYAPMQSLKAVA